MLTFYVSLIVSILLIVGWIQIPLVGVIYGSILMAVGLLLLFSVVEIIPLVGVLNLVREIPLFKPPVADKSRILKVYG